MGTPADPPRKPSRLRSRCEVSRFARIRPRFRRSLVLRSYCEASPAARLAPTSSPMIFRPPWEIAVEGADAGPAPIRPRLLPSPGPLFPPRGDFFPPAGYFFPGGGDFFPDDGRFAPLAPRPPYRAPIRGPWAHPLKTRPLRPSGPHPPIPAPPKAPPGPRGAFTGLLGPSQAIPAPRPNPQTPSRKRLNGPLGRFAPPAGYFPIRPAPGALRAVSVGRGRLGVGAWARAPIPAPPSRACSPGSSWGKGPHARAPPIAGPLTAGPARIIAKR